MAEETRTNPNGANQTTSDAREQVMWDFYVEGIANGQENAYAAAIKAGYEDATARQITIRSWFIERKEKLRRKEMVSKAEKVLVKTLEYEPVNEEGKIDNQLLSIQNKTAQFIAETQGKNDGWSKRTELTGMNGEKLTIQFAEVFKE